MPKIVIAYACEWKCRRNVITSRNAMIAHEKMCYRNPSNRACVICGNFENDKPERSCCAGSNIEDKLKYDCGSWVAKCQTNENRIT